MIAFGHGSVWVEAARRPGPALTRRQVGRRPYLPVQRDGRVGYRSRQPRGIHRAAVTETCAAESFHAWSVLQSGAKTPIFTTYTPVDVVDGTAHDKL